MNESETARQHFMPEPLFLKEGAKVGSQGIEFFL